jgi:hypothetical protein
VGLAVVLFLTLAIVAQAADARVPALKKGVANTVKSMTTLVGTLTFPILKLDNDGDGTALSLEVGADNPPLVVNTAPGAPQAGTATGLSADELDGKDASAFADAANLGTSDGQPNQPTDPVSFSKVKNIPADVVNRNADTLDGKDSSQFAIKTAHNYANAHDCDTPSQWNECAPVQVTVPAGKTYFVSVWSSFSAQNSGTGAVQLVDYCSAGKGPSIDPNDPCITPFAKLNGIHVESERLTAASSSAETNQLVAGTYTFFTALRPEAALANNNKGVVITKVMVRDTTNSF